MKQFTLFNSGWKTISILSSKTEDFLAEEKNVTKQTLATLFLSEETEENITEVLTTD